MNICLYHSIFCLVFLNDEEGKILKFVDDSEKGQREQDFYTKVFSEEKLLFFKEFVPEFHGVVSINLNGVTRIFFVITYIFMEK